MESTPIPDMAEDREKYGNANTTQLHPVHERAHVFMYCCTRCCAAVSVGGSGAVRAAVRAAVVLLL